MASDVTAFIDGSKTLSSRPGVALAGTEDLAETVSDSEDTSVRTLGGILSTGRGAGMGSLSGVNGGTCGALIAGRIACDGLSGVGSGACGV